VEVTREEYREYSNKPDCADRNAMAKWSLTDK
jgi:hypothetical protein